ncbi:MAG: hypothetical protein MUC83_12850 [Pirellula sp.]|jgi:hypothetical protein|nr:hypothetical protein [Pirellula sp.]
MVWHDLLAKMVMVMVCAASLEVYSFGDETKVLVVLGAAGEPEYSSVFKACGNRWKDTFGEGMITLLDGTEWDAKVEQLKSLGQSGAGDEQPRVSEESHRQRILDWISKQEPQSDSSTAYDLEREPGSDEVRWLILIGHGTTDRSGSKFNLSGPDLSAKELAAALKNTNCKWVIVNCSSSSGPFLAELSGANRIVITATKSGAEQNYSRFADYLSRSLNDPGSDLDHDSQISVLEAFLASSSGVARFYQDEGRLASEQALLDDNGDKRGTPALFFRGLRAIKAPSDSLKLDGEMAKRLIISKLSDVVPLTNENADKAKVIESKIDLLRREKGEMNQEEFANSLESLLLELADILLAK